MTSELINYVARYGGFCRDCADNDGVCDRGTPCDPKVFRAAIEHTIKALEYGIKHGFIENPFTRAVPDVPELVRWKHCEYPNQHKMMEHTDGEYVLHSQAAEIIAANDDLTAKQIGEFAERMQGDINHWKERAEAAETKLAQNEGTIKDPDAVHIALLRGDMAKPTIAQICHVYAGALLAKPDSRGEFNRGYVIACCNLINLHGADIVAVDTLKQLGITRTDIDGMELSEYDLSALILLESHFSADQIYAPESKK